MFPEHDLKSEFWHFVYARAIDPRYGLDQRPESKVLDSIEMNRDNVRYTLEDVDDIPRLELQDQGWPQVYPTLQEALLAFLIDKVARNEFSYPYEVWLRMIILVMADAQREPNYWLRVTACNCAKDHYRNPEELRGHKREHVMIISDDWSCLYRDVFELVRQAHCRTEPPDPWPPVTATPVG